MRARYIVFKDTSIPDLIEEINISGSDTRKLHSIVVRGDLVYGIVEVYEG